MEYIAHFSFDTEKDNEHGSFSMVAAAAGPDEAVEKFREKILQDAENGANGGMFNNLNRIYFDSLIEMKNASEKPIIMNFKSAQCDKEFWGEIRLDLADSSDDIECYGWSHKETEDRSEPEDREPFLCLKKVE